MLVDKSIQYVNGELSDAEWWVNISPKYATFAWDSSLLPVRRQAIIWTNPDQQIFQLSGTIAMSFWLKSINFLSSKCSWNVIPKTAAILSRPRCCKSNPDQISYVIIANETFATPSAKYTEMIYWLDGRALVIRRPLSYQWLTCLAALNPNIYVKYIFF